MPRWLESQITNQVRKDEQGNGQTNNTQTRTGSGLENVTVSGSETKREAGTKSEKTTKTASGTEKGTGRTDEKTTDTRKIDRKTVAADIGGSTTTTRDAFTENTEQEQEQASTQTQIEDSGGTISFSVPLRGGIGNSSANPEI